MRVLAVVTAAKAAELNALLQEECNGDTFQSSLVPVGSPPGTLPTHFWSSWPEHQYPFLTRAAAAGKLVEEQTRLRTDRTTARLSTTGALTFRYDETLSLERVLARLGLQRSDVPYIPPAPRVEPATLEEPPAEEGRSAPGGR